MFYVKYNDKAVNFNGKHCALSTYEPQRQETCLQTCAPSVDSDQSEYSDQNHHWAHFESPKVQSFFKVQIIIVQVIFHFLWDHWAHPGYFKNRIPLKPALGGVCSLANYSVAYEDTQSNRVTDFHDFVCSLFPKAILFDFYSVCGHFYIVKLGSYRGIHYFFLFLLKNIDCEYSLEPPRRGGSIEYPLSMF